jgi:hypothetical protein
VFGRYGFFGRFGGRAGVDYCGINAAVKIILRVVSPVISSVDDGLISRGQLGRKPCFLVCYRLLLVPPISATRVDIEVGI